MQPPGKLDNVAHTSETHSCGVVVLLLVVVVVVLVITMEDRMLGISNFQIVSLEIFNLDMFNLGILDLETVNV